MITRNETNEDYAYMFQCVKDLAEKICSFDYEPTILVADSAPAISNGFKDVFLELKKRVHCWFHVSKNILKELSTIKDKNIQYEIYNDITNFQHNVCEEEFISVAKLILTHWREYSDTNNQIESFINYFMKQWLNPKRMGWFDHYCDHVPVNNNSIEATNRYIKESDTGKYRERVSVLEFIKIIEDDFVKSWSTERSPTVIEMDDFGNEHIKQNVNQKLFHQEPLITLNDYTVSYQWNKLEKTIKSYKHQDGLYYCAPSSDKDTHLTSAICDNYFRHKKEKKWDTYDDYLVQIRKIRYVSINESNWKMSKCSCWFWSKNYKCKHMLAICNRKTLFDYLPVHKSIKIGRKRRPGRPKLTTKALEHQQDDEEYALSDSDYEDEMPKPAAKKAKKIAKAVVSDEEFDIFALDTQQRTSKAAPKSKKSTASKTTGAKSSISTRSQKAK